MKNITRRPTRLLLCLSLAAAGAAQAQDGLLELPLLMAQAEFERLPIFMGDGPDVFAHAGDSGGSRVVKGAPYCAEAVHETVQWLPDGAGGAPNRITRQISTMLCRDGEGRTRQEITNRSGSKVVYLRDPVAGESWVLDSSRKSARRLGGTRVTSHSSVDSAVWREYSERMREWARGMADRARSGNSTPPPAMPAPPAPTAPAAPAAPAVAPLPPLPPTPVVISRSEDGKRETTVNVVRMRNEDGRASFDWSMAPPAVQWRAQSWAPRGAGSVSPLGGKEIDGVRANGEKTTWVIEAGKVGNDKPIQITREVWTSPDLMVTLSSRDFDPRSGEVNYRLKSLKRGEPDAALMKVPPEFNRTPRPGSGAASGPTG